LFRDSIKNDRAAVQNHGDTKATWSKMADDDEMMKLPILPCAEKLEYSLVCRTKNELKNRQNTVTTENSHISQEVSPRCLW